MDGTSGGSITHPDADTVVGSASGSTGLLQIFNGSRASDYDGHLGSADGSVGEATVTGTGSQWNHADILFIGEGNSSRGTLTISSGGVVSDVFSYVGYTDGSEGQVTVTGAGSQWNHSYILVVGFNGTGKGSLTISDGGVVTSYTGAVGQFGSAAGEVTVTGVGSRWDLTTSLTVGLSPGTEGTLNLQSGGAVNVGTGGLGVLSLANAGGSTGVLNIGAHDLAHPTTAGTLSAPEVRFGAGTAVVYFNQTDAITFGIPITGSGRVFQRGTGTTTLTAANTYAGATTVENGTLIVDGTNGGSINQPDNSLFVGNFAMTTSTLQIINGGTVSDQRAFVGDRAPGEARAVVSGAGSRWDNAIELLVGDYGAVRGTLTISSGGVVSVGAAGAGTLVLAYDAVSVGTLHIGAANLAHPTTAGMLNVAGVQFGAGTGVINFNQTDVVTFGIPISGGGSVVQRGTGTTTLAGAHTYTGPTTVTDGTLIIDGSLAGTVAVNRGTLGGSGSTLQNVTIGDGLLNAGARDAFLSPGTFTTAGSLSLASDAVYRFELHSDTLAADKITAAGITLDAASLFAFTDLGSAQLALGTVFTLLENTSATAISGTFSNLPDLATFTFGANEYQADYSGGTGNDLTLTVVPEPSPTILLALTLVALLTWKRVRPTARILGQSARCAEAKTLELERWNS